MLELFQGNQRLRIISAILALLAWIYVRLLSSMVNTHFGETRFTLSLTITGLRKGESAHVDPQEVTIIATGLLPSDPTVRAVVDLAQRPRGVYHLPVAVEAPDTILSLSPANVTVTINEESS